MYGRFLAAMPMPLSVNSKRIWPFSSRINGNLRLVFRVFDGIVEQVVDDVVEMECIGSYGVIVFAIGCLSWHWHI
jgi:hypothetical protein